MLTDKAIKALKPREKPYKRADEKGLYTLVHPNGSVYWRFKYRYSGREKLISLGVYPDVKLKRAREKRDDARALLDRGIDPSAKRKAEKAAQADTFKSIAEEWLEKGCPPRSTRKPLNPRTVKTLKRRLNYALAHIGNWPIADIKATDLLQVLRRIEAEGKHETAHRVRSVAGRVFRYAVNSGRADRDISADLRDALVPVAVKHFAAIIKPKAFGEFLKKIDAYSGQPATRAALQLMALTFVRPGELRLSTWGEFDLDEAQWVIPAERMKMRRDHIVPLSAQAISILTELGRLTDKGPDSLVFASLRPGRPLSENTMNMALRSMDIGPDVHVSHGFRSTASTLLHELGYSPDLIETQLAHARPGVGGIYNRSHVLPQRRTMMQAWGDYLDQLKTGANVTAIGQGR